MPIVAIKSLLGLSHSKSNQMLLKQTLITCVWQVLWQLRTGNKTFLPRLGGGLLGIGRSPADAACYVITQADNTVRLVSRNSYLCLCQHPAQAGVVRQRKVFVTVCFEGHMGLEISSSLLAGAAVSKVHLSVTLDNDCQLAAGNKDMLSVLHGLDLK